MSVEETPGWEGNGQDCPGRAADPALGLQETEQVCGGVWECRLLFPASESSRHGDGTCPIARGDLECRSVQVEHCRN